MTSQPEDTSWSFKALWFCFDLDRASPDGAATDRCWFHPEPTSAATLTLIPAASSAYHSFRFGAFISFFSTLAGLAGGVRSRVQTSALNRD